jgi:hypothetical protein
VIQELKEILVKQVLKGNKVSKVFKVKKVKMVTLLLLLLKMATDILMV